MPLHEGAKPGSKEFGENVAAEVKAGKPQKQAVAIAYRESRADMSESKFDELKRLLDEFFSEEEREPEHKNDSSMILDIDDEDGQFTKLVDYIKTTAAIGHSFVVVVDPGDGDYEKKFYIDGDGAFRIKSVDAKLDAITARADALQPNPWANKIAALNGGIESLTARLARNDAALPYATDIKDDWRVEQDRGKWFAIGTALGERMTVKQKNEYDAQRYCVKMNRQAQEAKAGNERYIAERAEQAKKIRDARAGERAKQGRLF